MSDIDKPLLTVPEGAAYLGCCHRTMYRLIKAGRLPTLRLGREYRLRRGDLDALLHQGVAEASQEPGSEP